ncbi:reverse transcriptase-like protein [Candidatus Parcubacteria bacterium]|nr:MAG: reverse transcriptase-like protein [Candidatus Parcubacteria bacterium]
MNNSPLPIAHNQLVIYTDGGARGNPGPAAIGAVVGAKQYARYLGIATNNQAEYQAVIFALQKAKQLLGKAKAKQTSVTVYLDSELVAKQLRREYKVREPELKPLFVDVLNLQLDFKEVAFCYVPREKNKIADALVNEALDRAS